MNKDINIINNDAEIPPSHLIAHVGGLSLLCVSTYINVKCKLSRLRQQENITCF